MCEFLGNRYKIKINQNYLKSKKSAYNADGKIFLHRDGIEVEEPFLHGWHKGS